MTYHLLVYRLEADNHGRSNAVPTHHSIDRQTTMRLYRGSIVTKGTAGARKEFSAAAVYTSETFTCVQQDKAIQQDKANK